jgi:YD repeat-containing protein
MAYYGMFGLFWRFNYEEHLVFNSPDGYLQWVRGDGSVWSFGVLTVGLPTIYQTAAPANDTTTITSGATYWTLALKSGEKKQFDNTTGALLSIIDRNGNATQLSYDSSNRLATVTDAASRHLYFSYLSPSSPLVGSVTSDVGLSLSYAYDGQGRLTQVINPDSTFRTFEYDSQSFITAVKDSGGKVLESHTYDALGRGLTGSRANGVDSVTISYPQ